MSNTAGRPQQSDLFSRIKEVAAAVGMGILQAVFFVGNICLKSLRTFWHHMKTSRKYRQRFFSMMVLPVTAIYYEIVFDLSTERTLFHSRAWLFTFLFSLSWGLFYYLFCSASRRSRLNRRLIKVFMILMMLPFGLEFFVWRQFKTMFDLATVTKGAGGALRGFGGAVLKLIFSANGLGHLALFMLPFLMYYWKGPAVDVARKISRRFRFRVILGVIISWLVAVLLISCSGMYRPLYQNRYSFANAVKSFGVQTAFRKELQHAVTGKNRVSSFTIDEVEESARQETEPDTDVKTENEEVQVESATTEAKEYGFSQMDIDFETLAEQDGGEFAEIDRYVASLTPSKQNEFTGLFKGKNLIFLSAEAFSGYLIDENLTPTLYRLANKGMQFTDFYQFESAGTTGGETANLLGVLATLGGESMMATVSHNNYFTMGSQLDRLGYYGKAYHNNDYTFYERQDTHNNLGYSEGFMGMGNGMEAYVEEHWPESDREMLEGTLQEYIDHQPFNIYYMTVSGHSVYEWSGNYQAWAHKKEVLDLDYSEPVQAYLACNLDLEAGLSYLVGQLEEKEIADDTVIVLCADHYPYGLEEADATGNSIYLEELYGHEVNNTLERDKNRLIIWSGCLEDQDPIVVDTPVSAIDILPTLSNLFGLEWDSRLLPGRDVFSDAMPLVFDVDYDWKTELGTYIYGRDTFTPVSESIEVPSGYKEQIAQVVDNKREYCTAVLSNDYFGHVMRAFGPQESGQNVDAEREETDNSERDETGT